jgi:hypothetical protein
MERLLKKTIKWSQQEVTPQVVRNWERVIAIIRHSFLNAGITSLPADGHRALSELELTVYFAEQIKKWLDDPMVDLE